jgi:hypothetical protein
MLGGRHGLHARLGDVAAVGVGGESDDLAMDPRAPCQGVLAFLRIRFRRLADHQPITVAIEGARRCLGTVVACRGREQRVNTAAMVTSNSRHRRRS